MTPWILAVVGAVVAVDLVLAVFYFRFRSNFNWHALAESIEKEDE